MFMHWAPPTPSSREIVKRSCDNLQGGKEMAGSVAGDVASGRRSPLCLRDDLSGTYGSFLMESTVMAE